MFRLGLTQYIRSNARHNSKAGTEARDLTTQDEHYNNVKALDALNQELFQLCMGDKETVSDWGVLVETPPESHGIIPRTFSSGPHSQAEAWPYLGELPKRFKAMVAYLKVSTNEMIYSDYLWAAREAEKEEAMEPSCSQMADNQPKPKAMSFFSLQKLKGTQPVKTPVVQVAHLRQDSTDKERVLRVPTQLNWEQGRGVYGAPIQCIEGGSTGWETLLLLQQPRTFYLWVPTGKGIQDSYPFKLKGGDGTGKGNPDPQVKLAKPKATQKGMPKV